MIAVLALLLSPVVHATAIGDPIDEAIALHVTNTGLEHAGDIVQKLVPTSFPVQDLDSSFECAEGDELPLSYSLSSLDILLSTDDVELVASEGRLDLTLYATLSSSAGTLDVTGDCTVLTDLDESCGVQIPTTAVQASLGMTIAQVDGAFDVTVDTVTIDISPIGNPLSECTLASAIGTMLGQNEEAITDLILGLVEPSLVDLGPTIETSLEDALNSLNIDTEFALGASTIGLSLYPSLVQLGDDGLILGLGALVDADALSDCVDSGDGSDTLGGGWPDFSSTAGSTSLEHDAALFVGTDFANHLLYTLWATGLLCVDVGDYIDGGLSTGVLGGMLGDDFTELFPEDQPTALFTQPVTPPLIAWSDDQPPVSLVIEDLGLPLYVPLDDRQVRVFQVDVDADVGVNIELGQLDVSDTGDTGEIISDGLITELVLDNDDLVFRETYSDLLGPGYSEGLHSLVDTVLSGLIPADALPSVAIPDLLGARLDALIWMPTDDGQWQAGYLLLDSTQVEPIQVPACSAEGLGCGDDGGGSDISFEELLGCSAEGGGAGCDMGCDGTSCSTAGFYVGLWRGRLALLLGLGLAIGWRRRRDHDQT